MDYNTFLVLVYLRHPHRHVQVSLLKSTEEKKSNQNCARFCFVKTQSAVLDSVISRFLYFFIVQVYLRHPHRLVQMSLAGNLLQSTEDPLLVHPVKHLLRQVVAHHPLLGERVGRVSRHP